MNKKLLITLIFIVSIILCVGFPSSSIAKVKTIKIKMADVVPAKDNVAKGKAKFAELVKQKSNGRIQVTVFHGGQLGSGKETFEAARAGFLQMASDSYANIVTLTPVFEAWHLPFIFDSREQVINVYESPKVRAHVDEALAKIGLKALMFLEFGPRQICTAKKKVLKPEDLPGMKFRASRSPTEIASHKAWGLSSVTIDWPEVYDALKLGMVDGYTLIFPLIYSTNHHEVIRYIGELNWEFIGDATVANKKWWENLSDSDRKIISESAAEAMKWHQAMITEDANYTIKEMMKDGVDIYRYSPEMREKFKKIVMPVWQQFESTTCPKEWVNLILQEAGPVVGTPGDFGFIY
ncbi:MAG: TRAP transporter substrate-binding protein [Candidatus Ranarchaeia archaeon]